MYSVQCTVYTMHCMQYALYMNPGQKATGKCHNMKIRQNASECVTFMHKRRDKDVISVTKA